MTDYETATQKHVIGKPNAREVARVALVKRLGKLTSASKSWPSVTHSPNSNAPSIVVSDLSSMVSFLRSLLVPEMPAIAGGKCKTPHPGFELTLYWL